LYIALILLKEEKQKLFLHLLNWLEVVPIIDTQIVTWYKLSIDNLKNKADFRLLKIIFERSDEALEQLGDIYHYLIEKNKDVDFMKSEKIEFTEKLYRNNFKELANSIFLLSLYKGDFSVKDLYKKYNPQYINLIPR
jgi:hypothetical protein